jgi:fructose-bisphosphate aldolase class II
MLQRMDEILKKAAEKHYGVAAPNVFNRDTVQAVFEAANKCSSPIVIDCAGKFDLELIADVVKYYSDKYFQIPVALQVDHSKTFEVAVKAIRAGFTSIMVDRSEKPFEENIRETAELAKIAHAAGASIEAELGHVGQGADYEKTKNILLTEPSEAIEYVKRTSVDCLAVAVGTAHGKYAATPVLDFERLEKLRACLEVPLVLHGGSSTGDENLKKAVELGITKVNLYTDLVIEGGNKVKEYIANEKLPNYFDICQKGIAGYKELLIHYIKLFNSLGRI